MLKVPRGIRAFWSHGSARIGGVGILLREQFLQHFRPVQDDDWEEIVPGRIAVLHLGGSEGSLDLVTIYMQTGASADDRAARSEAYELLARRCRPSSEVLTVLLGDWNFTREARERISLETGSWGTTEGSAEHEAMHRQLLSPFGFAELFQEEMTHRSTTGTSRLDRGYVNVHVADQLCRRWSSVPLDWIPSLSTHRPIEIARRGAAREPGPLASTTVPLAPARHEDWPRRVHLRWQQLRAEDDLEDSPARRLPPSVMI